MATRLVHEVHALIAFGLPYSHIHARKDVFSQKLPGIRHRQVKHSKYQHFGKTWDFSNPYPKSEDQRIERIVKWKGDVTAEEYMVSQSHDVDDRCWDREDLSQSERLAVRRYWEAFCAWLVLNPEILKSWARVDVIAGKIHRVIETGEIWEEEAKLRPAYAALYNRVCFLIRCKKALRDALVEYGGRDPEMLRRLE